MMIAEILLILQFFLLPLGIRSDVEFRLTKRAPRAAAQEFPYQVSIQDNRRHICGGSLISQLHVLTAAHCVYIDPNILAQRWLTVEVGSTIINQGEEHSIRRISRHRDYVDFSKNHPFLANDIAVITLRDAVRPSPFASPISLPRSGLSLFEGAPLLVSGFGAAQINGTASKYLKKSYVYAVPQDECLGTFGHFIRRAHPSSVMCAKLGPEHGVCQGDSGGPLVFDEQGQRQLVGVVSAVAGTCGTGLPDIYTSVVFFMDYIHYELNYDFNVGEAYNSPAAALNLDDYVFPRNDPRQTYNWYQQPTQYAYPGATQYVYSGR